MINKKFRETRMKFNLTQKEFAQILNLKTNDVKLIEAGMQKITPATIQILKNKLSVDIDWLMGSVASRMK
ncbi:MAG: helix-turn-helix domain-containing protein [Sarcina sp.]